VGSQWIMHTIGSPGSATYAHDFQIADFDHNGLTDVACGTVTGGSMIFFQTSANVWQRVLLNIPSALIGTDDGFGAGDVNNDGNVDIVVSGAWVRNPGGTAARTAANWTLFNIGSYNHAYKAVVTDINHDGKNDIVFCCPESIDDVVWFTPNTSDYTGAWTRNLIASSIDHCHSLAVGDINGDGTLDVMIGQLDNTTNKQVAIFLNTGGTATNWTKQIVATTGTENAIMADIGNDGDLDIIGSNFNYNGAITPLEIWTNQTH
jgi:hypothetical protein